MPSLRFCLFLYVCLITGLVPEKVHAQRSNERKHQLSLFWEVPISYGARYQYQFSPKLSGNMQAGLLRAPNSTILINTMEALGTDESAINLIESAFSSGWVFEEGINYHFGRNYVGVYMQQVLLKGTDTPSDVVEFLFEVELNAFPRRGTRNTTLEANLLLNSNLIQAGVRVGRFFPLGDHVRFFAEVGISANLSAQSDLDSEQLDLTLLSREVDDFLDDLYAKYAYLPGVTIGITRSF